MRVQATQTIVQYQNEAIKLTITFTQPAFPHDPFASSREHVYITAEVSSADGQPHKVQVYLDAASDLVVSEPSSPNDAVNWEDVSPALQQQVTAAHGYRMYVHDAKIFGFNGDSTRPNWGQLYFATDSPHYVSSTAAGAQLTRAAFLQQKALPPFDTNQPRVSLGAAEDTPVMAMVLDLSVSGSSSTSSGVFTLFYDEVQTISWFGTPLVPYWKHQYNNDPILATLAALRDYTDIRARADAYDKALIASTSALSGDKFATLLALAHREVTGASTVVWNAEKQTPWWFIKEMSTGGAMSTVDVLFPGAPLYIALAPEALKLMLWPLLSWSNNETSDKVTINWAPHDFGGYPFADANAAAQEEMPLEESGNMILMIAAIAIRQHGDVNWLVPYRPILQEWVDFINSTLPDPDQQLCTDDFEGPSPHNANSLTPYDKLRTPSIKPRPKRSAFPSTTATCSPRPTGSVGWGHSHLTTPPSRSASSTGSINLLPPPLTVSLSVTCTTRPPTGTTECSSRDSSWELFGLSPWPKPTTSSVLHWKWEAPNNGR